MRYEAIFNTHPTVVSVNNEIEAWDKDGNVVTLNETLIAQEITRLENEYNSKEYQILRKKEYPPIEDYLDGIVKGDTQQVQDYIDACLAVKAKYPKPE